MNSIGSEMWILGGNMFAVDDLGTSCHFNLLPYPWNKEELIKVVTDVLTQELYWRDFILNDPTDVLDREILLRPIGVRVWRNKEGGINQTLSHIYKDGFTGISDAQQSELLLKIDEIATLPPDFTIRFGSTKFDITSAIESIENFFVIQTRDYKC